MNPLPFFSTKGILYCNKRNGSQGGIFRDALNKLFPIFAFESPTACIMARFYSKQVPKQD
jgi:hypothetical protein